MHSGPTVPAVPLYKMKPLVILFLLFQAIAGEDVFFTKLSTAIAQSSGILGNGETPLNFDVTVETFGSSIAVEGTNLWQLTFFGNTQIDGNGAEYILKEQLLNDGNSAQTYDGSGANLYWNFDDNINIQEVGPYTSYPFLCLTVRRTDAPSIEFTANTLTACSAITLQERSSGAPDWRQQTDDAIAAAAAAEGGDGGLNVDFIELNGIITQSAGIRANGKTPLGFEVTVGTSDSSSMIEGTGLWGLSFFGSSTGDGTGSTISLSKQLLTPKNRALTLTQGGESLAWEFNKDIDLATVGPYTPYPNLCLRISKAGSPSVEFTANEITACSEITLTERSSAERWVQQTQDAIQAAKESKLPEEFNLDAEDEREGECDVTCEPCAEGQIPIELEGECCAICEDSTDPCASVVCDIPDCPPEWSTSVNPGECCPSCQSPFELLYIFSFVKNYDRNAVGNVWVQPTSKTGKTSGQIRDPNRNKRRTYTFKSRLNSGYYTFSGTNPTGTGLQNTVLFVEADNHVQIVGFHKTNKEESMDTFTALPIKHLGYDYVVASYTPSETFPDALPNFVFTAIEDNTDVDIRFVQDFEYEGEIYNTDNPLTITLDRYQTFHIETPFDATGTRVTGNKPLSVLSGSGCASIPVDSPDCDYIIEFLTPVTSWGKHATVAPLKSRTSGYIVRVIAASPNTEIVFSDDSAGETIHSGEFVERDFDGILSISATEPVLVVQYSKSDSTDGQGKAAMVIVPSTERSFRGTQVLQVPTVGKGFTHFLTIFLQSDNVNDFRMNQRGVSWEHLGRDNFGTNVLRTKVNSGLQVFRHRLEDTYRGYIYGSKPGGSSYIHPIQHDHTPLVDGPVCRVWAGLHFLTFDDYQYDFNGASSYIIAEDCRNDDTIAEPFRIVAETTGDGSIALIQSVTLEHDGHSYTLSHPNGVQVDGNDVMLPYNADGVSISFSYPHRVLSTELGIFMRFDDSHNADFNLPPIYRDRTCGLCGFYDNDALNDLRTKEGVMANTPEEFAPTWRLPEAPPALILQQLRDCPPDAKAQAAAECSALSDDTGVFSSCMAVIDPQPFYDACVSDMCQFMPDTSSSCDSIEQYIYACHGAGGSVPDWRKAIAACRKTCPAGMNYNRCGTSCPATCINPDGDDECPYKCLESCDCPNGQVYEGDVCVDVTECGCVMNDGAYVAKGYSVVNEDCSEVCTCLGQGNYACEPLKCAKHASCGIQNDVRDCYCDENFEGNGREKCEITVKTCQVFGDPHYDTFDGKTYTFQGDCKYTLVTTCRSHRRLPDFQVVGHNIRRHAHENFTFQRGIALHIYGRTFELAWRGDVKVDNVSVVDRIPFKTSRLGLSYDEEGRTVIKTSFGLKIAYDGKNDAVIDLPVGLFGKVCGLCADADGDENNEFMSSTGALVSDVNEFADSWGIPPCGNTLPAVIPCSPGTEKAGIAAEKCDPIINENSAIAYCHKYAAPAPFFETCSYDTCSTYPDTKEAFCDSVKAYLIRCRANGGTPPDSIKDLLTECGGGYCPIGYSEYEKSCYKYYAKDFKYRKAERYCKYRGHFLATIQSEGENDFVTSLTNEVDAWIGGVRDGKRVFPESRTQGNEDAPIYNIISDFVIDGARQLDVAVKTARDVTLLFANSPDAADQYVVVVGADYGTKTQIKRCLTCDVLKEFASEELDVNKWRRFQFRFDNGVISVGRPGENMPFLSWEDPDPLEINYFGYMNKGERAVWRFPKEFKWTNGDDWTWQNYHPNEPNDEQGREDCLQTNFDGAGLWNDHFCTRQRGFVCETPMK